ncbi:MAG: ThiF family adenylyltransferase [Desulfatitalea sp.]|nr:ThiF family adenylyltransferase [Desulfatitalea sp.]
MTDSVSQNGASLHTLNIAETERIAAELDLPIRRIEIEALANGIVPLRYLRNQRAFSSSDQMHWLDARAAVVGLGGLGGSLVEILSRAGVGTLVLIDGDRFEEHNLNRQWLSTQKGVGQLKAEAAAERVAAINGAVQAESHPVFLTAVNAKKLIQGCDIVIDCLDDIPSRFALETAAKQLAIPMVSGAVAGMTGHVTTIYPQDEGLSLIYGPRQAIESPKGVEIALGCPPQTVATVAAMESAEALKVLTGRPQQLLRNKLWVVDLTDCSVEILALA